MGYQLERSAFATWLDRYGAAWEARDADRAAGPFTEDAVYRENPFEPPFEGRAAVADYWTRVTAGQRDVRFSYEVLACEGAVGLCHWHAAFTAMPGGEAVDLDGIFRCVFADDAQVSRLEEWWHVQVVPAGAADAA